MSEEEATQDKAFDGVLPDNWRDTLPDDLKTNGVLETVKDISNLAKMAVDGRNYMSTAVRIPSEDASDEVRQEFKQDLLTKVPDLMVKPDIDNDDSVKEVMKTLGMPDDPTGYELPELPDEMKEGLVDLSQKAHEAGLTKKQFSAISNSIVDGYKKEIDTSIAELESDNLKLKEEWGQAYNTKVDQISHFAKQTGFSDGFVEAIKEGNLDSTNMKAFDTVIQGYEGEAVEIGRQATNPDAVMTPAEADARVNDIMGNKEHAYWNAENPEHQAARDKVLELVKIAESGKEKTDTEKFRDALLSHG